MAKVKYYASRQTGLRRIPSSARLSTNGAQEDKGQKEHELHELNELLRLAVLMWVKCLK